MASEALSAGSANSHEYVGRDLEAMDFAINYHRWIRDEFAPYLGARVAEVGAGTGAFSELLLEHAGVEQLVAVEPSERMHATLVERVGSDPRVTVHRALFRGVSEEYAGELDTLVYVNVLEHVEDDRGELTLAFESLAPGGHICIFVPAVNWLYSRFDAELGHHRRYKKKELVEKATAAGFETRRARYFDSAGIVPWLVAFRFLRRELRAGQVRTYDKYVVPLMRRVEGVVAPPLGKNLLVVGRKPAIG